MKPDQLRTTVENVITQLLRAILQVPQDLEIMRDFEGGSMTIWNLRCNGADRGRVIGKGGERFASLRVIALLIGQRHHHQCKLGEVLPSKTPALAPPTTKFHPNPDWPKLEILDLALDVGLAVFGPETNISMTHSTPTSTVIQFLLGDPIPPQERQAAQVALDNIFSAIGNTCGADLSVDLA